MQGQKQNILDAAILVLNNDYSASLELIAEQAGIHRRTVHLYFKTRQELIEACKVEMMTVCERAMKDAYGASSEPLKQLELMLYAAIDCGAKYAFLNKIYGQSTYSHVAEEERNGTFDTIKYRWFKLVEDLQAQNVISNRLSVAWIFTLFGGMISNTIDAVRSGDVATNDIKPFAWFSFSKSIGL